MTLFSALAPLPSILGLGFRSLSEGAVWIAVCLLAATACWRVVEARRQRRFDGWSALLMVALLGTMALFTSAVHATDAGRVQALQRANEQLYSENAQLKQQAATATTAPTSTAGTPTPTTTAAPTGGTPSPSSTTLPEPAVLDSGSFTLNSYDQDAWDLDDWVLESFCDSDCDLQATSDQLVANAPALLVRIRSGSPATYQQCLRATGWVKAIAYRDLSPNDQFCVRTHEDRRARVRVVAIPSEVSNDLTLEGKVWEPQIR
jgi:type II secretory pathway pseudopilin PulG